MLKKTEKKTEKEMFCWLFHQQKGRKRNTLISILVCKIGKVFVTKTFFFFMVMIGHLNKY
uniref:Uncharacterized protein n=1 Tax=Meloidogyne enterolobii TaxID=390850 RepID=A0A6V7X7A3_MELEN|nr:unnamed protein product [Meloidogyne enterolobii]